MKNAIEYSSQVKTMTTRKSLREIELILILSN